MALTTRGELLADLCWRCEEREPHPLDSEGRCDECATEEDTQRAIERDDRHERKEDLEEKN